MRFSIIIPSFNQHRFIAETFRNLSEIKKKSAARNIEIEILLFDNNSVEEVQSVIKEFNNIFDYVDISNDAGQYDAINKGIKKISGDYWTWLNTDDMIDAEGFFRMAGILLNDPSIDYIYGDIEIIDENSNSIRIAKAHDLKINSLVNDDPGIYQPGSFFRKGFTDKIGLLMNYRCCFDYEYVLRIMKSRGKLYRCDFTLSLFRLYSDSKSGSIVPVFIKEQLAISEAYGRTYFSKLWIISQLRLFKRYFLK